MLSAEKQDEGELRCGSEGGTVLRLEFEAETVIH